jgi:hypothetical protein
LTKVMVRSGTFRSLKELGEEEIISKSWGNVFSRSRDNFTSHPLYESRQGTSCTLQVSDAWTSPILSNSSKIEIW